MNVITFTSHVLLSYASDIYFWVMCDKMRHIGSPAGRMHPIRVSLDPVITEGSDRNIFMSLDMYVFSVVRQPPAIENRIQLRILREYNKGAR